MMLPIMIQQSVENHTFNLNFSDSGFMYKLKIDNIHIDSLNIETKTITFIPGTNNIKLMISGLDLFMKVDGAIYALWFIPLKTASLNATNLTFSVELEPVINGDNVNWQLKD